MIHDQEVPAKNDGATNIATGIKMMPDTNKRQANGITPGTVKPDSAAKTMRGQCSQAPAVTNNKGTANTIAAFIFLPQEPPPVG